MLEWSESDRAGSGKGLDGRRRLKRGKGFEEQWRVEVVEKGSRGGPDGGVWRGVLAAAIMPGACLPPRGSF